MMMTVVVVNASAAWSTLHFEPEVMNSSSVRGTYVGCVHVIRFYCLV
jgi:hypothetical protein